MSGTFQRQLLLALNGLVVGVVGLVGVAGVWLMREQMLGGLRGELDRRVELASKHLTDSVEGLRQDTARIAAAFEVRRAVSLLLVGREGAAADLEGLLPRMLSEAKLDLVELVDRNGELVVRSVARGSAAGAFSAPPAGTWAAVREGRAVPFYETREAGGQARALARVAVPVLHLNEMAGAVLGGRWMDQGFAASFKERTEHEVVVRQGALALASTLPAGTEEGYTFREVRLEPSAGAPMALAIGAPLAPLEAATWRLIRSFLLALLLGGLLASWLAVRMSRSMTAPLETLTAQVAALGAGQVEEVAVPPTSTAEVRTLMVAFNGMVRDLKASRERLLQSERLAAWREAARRIAHEIKNPLMPLQVGLEGLRRHRGTPAFDQAFEEHSRAMLEEVERLKRFVNEFAQFARLPQFVFERADVNALVREVGELHRPLHPRVEVRYELSADGPVEVDAGQLKAALVNLVKNALEALGEEGTLVLSTARGGAGPRGLQIGCADTGPGLPPAVQERLFTPYLTTKAGGTGLGLPFVHEVVRAHGGAVQVESEPGRGTRFTLSL